MTTAPLRIPREPAQTVSLCEPLQFPVLSSTSEPLPFRPVPKPRRDGTFIAALIDCAEEHSQKQRAAEEQRRREAAERRRMAVEERERLEREEQSLRQAEEQRLLEEEERQRREDEQLIRRAAADERRRLEAKARERCRVGETQLGTAATGETGEGRPQGGTEHAEIPNPEDAAPAAAEAPALCQDEERTPAGGCRPEEERAWLVQSRLEDEEQLRLAAEEHRVWEERLFERRANHEEQARNDQRILQEEDEARLEQIRRRTEEQLRFAAEEHRVWEEAQQHQENIPQCAQPLPPAMLPEQIVAAAARPSPHPAPGMLGRAWSWLNRKCALSAMKQLRVAETVSLGEKRFVAVVQVDGRRFLIGGGASGVAMLTPLAEAAHGGSEPSTAFVEGRG